MPFLLSGNVSKLGFHNVNYLNRASLFLQPVNTLMGRISRKLPRWAQSFENIQKDAFRKLMGLNGLAIQPQLTNHSFFLSTNAC